MQPFDQAWALLKFEDKTLRDQASDPLDIEYTCPNCGGTGGGYDEEGALDSYVSCLTCGGTGSIAPTRHPGHPDVEPDGIQVGATRFDVRDKDHIEEFDVANAAPTPLINTKKLYIDMAGEPGYSARGVLDPYRYGYPKGGRVKMTRYPITDLSQAEPGLEHREPAVYAKEIDGNPSFSVDKFQGYFTMSEPFDAAWELLKMPVVDTDVPGVRMAYQQKEHLMGHPEYGADQEVIDAYNHPKGMIGHSLGTEKYGTDPKTGNKDWNKTRNVGRLLQMTPNEYFDHLAEFGLDTEPKMIDGKEYRWADLGPAHIQSMIDGIKEGQVMGMPAITAGGSAQEGGHRMEALRQMGHGDTKVPVLNFHGENPDLDYQKYMDRLYEEEGY